MSLNGSYPSSFPATIAPLHYPLPNPYLYRRPMIQGKDEQRPPTASSSSVSVNNSGNSSPAPSLASVASSEVSSPPPASPHTFNERPASDYYAMIPKQQFNPATPVTAPATATPAVPSYPATSYPSIDFPSPYGYDFYSNPSTATPKLQSLPAIPPLPAMPIQSMNTDPSTIYAAREFPPYDPMMAAAYDPSAYTNAYARNRMFDPRMYPPMRGYAIDDEWYADANGKKRGADKKRGRYDDEEAARKRARAVQRSNASAAVNPAHKQRSIIHCGIPRAYLEKKTNGETVEVNDDDRVYFLYSPFFGKELDVYYADDDPFHRPLFRASALHKKFGCATNKMDMYLCRKKAKEGPKCGIFQCLCFDGRREEHGLFGLKAGTYFVSEDACAAFAEHAKEQRFRKKRTAKAKREKERRENGQTDAIDDLSSDEEEEVPRNPPASNDRGVEMMVHMIQMFSKSNDSNSASKTFDNKNESIDASSSTSAIIPPAAIAVSNPSA